MPRIRRGTEEIGKPLHFDLVTELIQELRDGKECGQPRIEETEFPTGAIRVTVLWDKWDRVPDHERADVILRAYEEVEGRPYRERVALAIGLTFPEAREVGLLRCSLQPQVRSDDPKTVARYYQAMRDLGASDLFDRGRPELWFASRGEMEACLKRLKELVPGSDESWLCIEDVGFTER